MNKTQNHTEIIHKYQNLEKVIWWNEYIKKSEIEKESLVHRWSEYYKQCAQTTEAELFRETKKALFENNLPRVRELANQAREMLANGFFELPKPSKYDPSIVKNESKVAQYLRSKDVVDNATQKGISELF